VKVRGTRAALRVLPVLMLVAGMTLSMLCGRHIPPDRPVIVAGPVEGSINVNYAFTATAVSPEGDSIAIRFDWGDGDTSDWSGYVASGEEVTMSRTWADTGTYHVKAQARTPAAAESDWSEPHPVTITGEPGTIKWRYETGVNVISSPAIGDDGTVYVGTWDGTLVALRPDGSVIWQFELNGFLFSPPGVGDDGTIYLGTSRSRFGSGYFYAINPDGTLRWRVYQGDELPCAGPAIAADGTVYVAGAIESGGGGVRAYDPDGNLRWRYEVGDWVCSSPAVGVDGAVYFGSSDSFLYALHPDGNLKWRAGTGYNGPSSPAIAADGTVYIGSGDGHLYAINPDGTRRWRYRTDGFVYSSPSIGADGTIYVGSSDRCLYAISPDGTLRWRYRTGHDCYSSPAVRADGAVYVVSDGLYAVTPDGELKWRYADASGTSSPAIAEDGTVYFEGSEKLHAIYGDSLLANTPWPKYGADSRNTGRVRRP